MIVCLAAGVADAALLPVASLVQSIAAGVVYAALAFALRAVPSEAISGAAPQGLGLRHAPPPVVVLRGHNVNVWDLRPLERLTGELRRLGAPTGSNLHQVEGLGLPIVPARAPRDSLPAGRAAGAAAYALGERYLGCATSWRERTSCTRRRSGRGSARRRRELKRALGFRLVLTVWETIPWRDAYRSAASAPLPARVLAATDLFLAATERARDALLLEGVPGRADRGRRRRASTSARFAPAARPARGRARRAVARGGWCGRRATRTCCARSRCCAAVAAARPCGC